MDNRTPRVQFYSPSQTWKTNIKADLRSRQSGHKRGENNNEDITMLKPEWFRRMEVGIEGQDKDFIERINEAMFKKKMINRVVKKALAGKEKEWEQLSPHTAIKWQKHQYVPKDKKLREDIIRAHHDMIAAGPSSLQNPRTYHQKLLVALHPIQCMKVH